MQTSTTSLITKSRRERQSFSQRSQAQFSYFWSVFMNDVEPFFRVFFLTTFIPRPKMKYVEIAVALRSATIFTPILAFCIFNPFSKQPLRESTLSVYSPFKQAVSPAQCCQPGHLMARFFKSGNIGTSLAIENIFWPFTISGHKPGQLGFGASFSNFSP